MLWVLAIAAALIAAGLGYQRWIERVSLGWPVAEATLEWIRVEKTNRTWRVQLRFAYLAGGNPYGGTWFKFFRTEAEAADLCKSLKESLALVRYDPSRPERSYFDPYRDSLGNRN